MKHKGYKGRILHKNPDGSYFGEVINIKDVVTFYGKTKKDAKQAFKDSVDVYIEFKKETENYGQSVSNN